ncbi:MAG TPA: NAD(P)/FAD-dependent oxidoreductase [Thermomicrobiales bacterium]|nr:NAD(P)/FAD-dependent oxidoreductase [Thermomicrobiales bacterium]
MLDAIIVGGSYAGMSAALQLARARRSVTILDDGQRRNRFASAAHGLLGQDGRSPGDIAKDARTQLLRYPTVSWHDARAVHAERTEDGFSVQTSDGQMIAGRRLVLATGVVDGLPSVPGLVERWGRSVFHCPYCHGYELDEGPLGVLAVGDISFHQAQLIPEWGPTTFFTNGVIALNDDQARELSARGVTIERELVREVSGERASVELVDGRVIDLAGLFVASRVSPASPLATQLECEMMESPMGTSIQTHGVMETSVAGVFACGDVARPVGNLALAIADGNMAGAAVHRSLIFD